MQKIVKLAKTKIITGKNMCKTSQSSTHVNLKVPATDKNFTGKNMCQPKVSQTYTHVNSKVPATDNSNKNVNSCNSTKKCKR